MADEAVIAEGLARSRSVLGALERIADQGPFLVGGRLSLADLHLAPMLAYFVSAPEGRDGLREYERLSAWWRAFSEQPSLSETAPGLPSS